MKYLAFLMAFIITSAHSFDIVGQKYHIIVEKDAEYRSFSLCYEILDGRSIKCDQIGKKEWYSLEELHSVKKKLQYKGNNFKYLGAVITAVTYIPVAVGIVILSGGTAAGPALILGSLLGSTAIGSISSYIVRRRDRTKRLKLDSALSYELIDDEDIEVDDDEVIQIANEIHKALIVYH